MVTRRMSMRNGRDTRIDDWLKTHTLQDMEEIVTELASDGENVSDMSKVVHELEEMAEEEHEWEQQGLAKPRNEGQTA